MPPIVSTARHGDLSIRLSLPTATFLAGEAGRAAVAVRNDGPEAVGVAGSHRVRWVGLAVRDERGEAPPPWPWAGFASALPTLPTVAPGRELSAVHPFQVPPEDQAAGHTYALRAEVRVIPLTARGGPTNQWAVLQTEPLPLRVLPPPPDRRLRLDLAAGRAGWWLRATDARVHPPPGPLWGRLQASAHRLGTGMPLPDSADGRWSRPWDDYMLASDGDIRVRAWVAAVGYVTAVARRRVRRTIFGLTWSR